MPKAETSSIWVMKASKNHSSILVHQASTTLFTTQLIKAIIIIIRRNRSYIWITNGIVNIVVLILPHALGINTLLRNKILFPLSQMKTHMKHKTRHMMLTVLKTKN